MKLFDKVNTYKRKAEQIINIIKDKNSSTNTSKPSKKSLVVKEFRAAGVKYYLDNIHKLASINPEWKKKTAKEEGYKKIYRYSYVNKPVKLIEEPDNRYDKNAIQVVVAGELVGHVPADECLNVKKILHSHEIKYISAFIGGGQFKLTSCGKIVNRDEESIHVNIRIGYID